MKPQRVYRLHVTYPEGSDEYDWEPEGWEKYVEETWGRDHHPRPDDPGVRFSWPGLRNFLSRSGAERRAWEFQRWGATVEIEESEPIAWTGTRKPVRENPRPEVHEEEPAYAGSPF